jgi:SAM-dependent methyltransferase
MSAQAVLDILQYSIGKKRKTFGHGFDAAYHTVELGGVEYEGQRDVNTRLDNLKDYDFEDKVVMDLGCNSGGMLLKLHDKIDMGIGVDYNAKVINAANAIKAYENIDNVHFYTFDLAREPLHMLNKLSLHRKPDVFLILAVALWIPNWKELVQLAAALDSDLIYESNGKPAHQEEQEEYLKTLYKNVNKVADESNDDNRPGSGAKLRKLFICTDPLKAGDYK